MMTQHTLSSALDIRPNPAYAMSGSKRNKWNPLTLLLAFLGFFGMVASLLSLYQPKGLTLVVLIVAGTWFLLAALIQLLPKHSGRLTVIGVFLVLAVLLVRVNQATAGIQFLINSIYCNAHQTEIAYFTVTSAYNPTTSMALVICCAVVLLAFFFTFFTIKQPRFILTAGISFLLIEPGLYLGLPVKAAAMAPLLAYWCGMLALRLALCCTKTKLRTARHTAAVCGSVTALFVLLIYSTVVLIGVFHGYTRTEADCQRRQDLSDSLADFDVQNIPESLQLLGTAMGLDHVSRVSKLGTKSKLRFRDKPELTLSFDALPDSTMYLKGFTGSTYDNNSWKVLSDHADAKNGNTVFSIIDTYDCAPQNFPFLFQRSLLPDTGTFSCTVTPEKRDGRYYQPYTSFSANVSYSDDCGARPYDRNSYSWTVSLPQTWVLPDLAKADLIPAHLNSLEAKTNQTVQDFLSALGISGSNAEISTRFSADQAADSPAEISGKVIPAMLMESLAYREFAADAYTVLPEDDALEEIYAALPESLTSQKPETPTEQYQALCAIREWMAQRTTYTIAPGKTPHTRDFVNFFLMENQKGYCVHYASAGTILARYLGIPARYCEGYLVGNDMLDSAKQTDNAYSITLTDRQAHAWCEFYIDGYGWMPFEMTPGYFDTSTTQETTDPSEMTTTIETSVTDAQMVTSVLQTSKTLIADTTTAVSDTVLNDVDESIDNTSLPTLDQDRTPILEVILRVLLYALLTAMLIAAIVLLRLWHVQRRNRILRDTLHPRQAVLTAYRYLFQLLQFIGLRYHGQLMMTFCEEAVQYLEQKQFPSDAAVQIIPMMLAMDLGRKFPEKDVQRKAADAIAVLAQSIYTSCNPLKRICMKYLLHLI